MQSPPFPRYLVPPRSKYSPQHPSSLTPSASSPPAISLFLNMSILQGGVVSISPNPQTGGPPLVGCPRMLVQIESLLLREKLNSLSYSNTHMNKKACVLLFHCITVVTIGCSISVSSWWLGVARFKKV